MIDRAGATRRGLAAVLSVLLVSACEASTSGRNDSLPTAPPSSSTDAPVDPPVLRQRWSTKSSDLQQATLGLPTSLDPAAVASAPYLHKQPIGSATIAVGASAFGSDDVIRPGDVAILGADGWRRVSLTEAGLRRPNNIELAFALSPDGSTLALGDRLGIVLLDLASSDAIRRPTRIDQPVDLRWDADSTTITFVDRDLSSGWRLNVATGAVSPDPVRLGGERTSANGVVASIRREPSDAAVRVDDGQQAVELPLTQSQVAWASISAWTARDVLVIAVSDGPRGAVITWDPTLLELRRVVSLPSRGLVVSVAANLL